MAGAMLERERECLCSRMVSAQPFDQLDAAEAGQAQIDDRHVRAMRADDGERAQGVARVADDLEVGHLRDHDPERSPHDGVIVHEQHADRRHGLSGRGDWRHGVPPCCGRVEAKGASGGADRVLTFRCWHPVR